MRHKGARLQKLPFDAEKIETKAVLRKEAQARQVLAELKGYAAVIPNQNVLISAISLQEAKESSAIENIVTTHDDLYQSLAMSTQAGDLSAKEVINYREAVYTGFDIVRKNQIIRVSDIIKLQEIVTGNNAGIRRLPGTALVNDATNEIVYTPPQDYAEIVSLLNNFCMYLNDDENSIWKLAVLHYQFESIHPFYDGNGRTGRILNVLYLLLKNYLDTPLLYLSSFIIKHKETYYRLLSQARNMENFESWVIYILDGIIETSKQTLDKIRKIKDMLELTFIEVKDKCYKIYSKDLVEIIFENPYSKIDFLVSALGINRKTASKYLAELEDKGFLTHIRVGKEKLYINGSLMELLKVEE